MDVLVQQLAHDTGKEKQHGNIPEDGDIGIRVRRNAEMVAVMVRVGLGEVEGPVEQVVVLNLGGCGFGIGVVDSLELGKEA